VPLRALSPLILIALGALAAVLVPGVAGTALAIMLAGTGCVVAVSLAFWYVGKAEDRDRDAGRS
jgi:hypothetical protein